ncbi:major facilitator superfamily transporter [Colletotrichum graminicola M1.001]|uniref:Major facilitator superfamily transporter n=1 Tax=Colletotrichum graminicola (strain M1.001 / M2 / FGSC 10212) TaxID=645133 RepID=E3QZY4_COLGM|nr:major facilitator superfamily transporter [Colletotrichum graminicola M1.001]EFQ36422.1 major facilitator superfamily transporter [Colletotrichum graminicola M1.001]
MTPPETTTMTAVNPAAAPQASEQSHVVGEHDMEKNTGQNVVDISADPLKPGSDDSSEHKQEGVKKVEAITSVWSMKMLWVVFALLYLVTFTDGLLQAVEGNLTPYVTSAFGHHGLLATTSIVSTILGGVSQLTIAKIIDIRGRAEGFLGMVFLVTIGMIMMATCQNVETYAAAQTIYWVGHLGLGYIITIVLADMTSLKNRMTIIALNGTPIIATTFAGPKISELFYEQVNFRWAFGAFAIILIGFSIPVVIIFFLSEVKAKKTGLIPPKQKTRSTVESLKHYAIEFDAVGLVLVMAGWSMLLLPFSLVSGATHEWKSPTIICLIVFGVVALALFAVWERFFAKVSLFPYQFLKDRTVLGACLVYGIMFTSIYCWDSYYQSYLQVAHNQDITSSGYILNTFSLTSAIVSPLVGVAIRYTGRFKYIALAGVPICILGTALLIHFRTPSTSVGYLVMCQIFNGVSSGIFNTCAQIAIMSSVTHQEIAIALALYGLFGSIGAGIGLAIAGGIWNNLLEKILYQQLPAGSKDLTASIFASIETQLSYPMGSPIREAIIAAYADVQRKMVITGCAFIPLIFIALLLWRNINVKTVEEEKGKQTKGTVF